MEWVSEIVAQNERREKLYKGSPTAQLVLNLKGQIPSHPYHQQDLIKKLYYDTVIACIILVSFSNFNKCNKKNCVPTSKVEKVKCESYIHHFLHFLAYTYQYFLYIYTYQYNGHQEQQLV